MPKAFVLTGGSRSQLGLLEQARALGHDVCVVDGAETAPLLAEADHAIVRSFTDVNGVIGDLEARAIEPVAVATMGSDQAVLPTAQLAERLGLPGLAVETARTVADKRRMRRAFERRKVLCPKGREAGSFEEAEQAFHQLGAPVVVKPVDGSAQRGVTEVRAEGELLTAVERALAASRTGAVVLEQYLEGDEYTVNGFLLDGEYFPMSVTQRLLHPAFPTRSGSSASRTPPAGRSGSRPGRPTFRSGSTTASRPRSRSAPASAAVRMRSSPSSSPASTRSAPTCCGRSAS
jgi:biotin carboxylase